MRILLVEDEVDLQRLLKKALVDAGYVVDIAGDGEEGHFLGETEPYDAVILDLGLPKIDGVTVLERWRKAGHKMPVLILTARDRWSDKVAGFDAGADDYVAKPFYTEELLARLRALLRHSAGLASPDIEIGTVRVDTRTSRVTVDGNPVKLTSAEYRLLSYLAHHKGEVLSRTDLVEHLYDQDFDRDSNTIEVFVGRLRKKLGVEIIHTVRGLGYRLDAPETAAGSGTMTFLPKTNSLTFRLIAAAAVWCVVGLLAGGFVLSGVFRTAVQESFDNRLTFDLEGLVAAAQAETPERIALGGRFGSQRYERIFSGWYWQILPEASPGALPQRSRSLWDFTLVPQDMTLEDNMFWGFAGGPDNQRVRVLSRQISFPAPNQEDAPRVFQFIVAGDIVEIETNVVTFNRSMTWSFAALGLGLIVAILIQVRVGLVPLRRVSEALARIREGRARELEGDFPAEIAPLATELNSLIAHSAEVVGRARTHVANLAHFLKTPLTVLANEASGAPGPLADTVDRQVTVMRRQVDHYLARARTAGALDVLGSRTEVGPVLRDLARILPRMHPDKTLTIEVQVSEELAFRGEREDLEELAGNLIDNACKWAREKILIEAEKIEPGRVVIRIGDDGPGLAPDERARAMERGERLDESVPGSGLGLAIVRDISKLYGGSFALGESKLGGLEASLELPTAL